MNYKVLLYCSILPLIIFIASFFVVKYSFTTDKTDPELGEVRFVNSNCPDLISDIYQPLIRADAEHSNVKFFESESDMISYSAIIGNMKQRNADFLIMQKHLELQVEQLELIKQKITIPNKNVKADTSSK